MKEGRSDGCWPDMMNDLFVWPSTLNLKEKEPVEMVTNYSAIFWSLLLSGETFIPPLLLWARISSLLVYHCSTDTADFIITSYLSVIHFRLKCGQWLWKVKCGVKFTLSYWISVMTWITYRARIVWLFPLQWRLYLQPFHQPVTQSDDL